MNQQTVEEGKTWAIVSYFTFIGLIIAVVMNLEKKNPFTFFHIRQMLGLILLLIFSNLVEKYVNSWLGTAFWAVTFVSWLYGVIIASQGKAEPIPVLGPLFQDWFKNLK
ncbi:hypothetical protein M0G43_11005 [Subsaxibacter sp. CAU 1640]|uniref:hypothetical protein n=1 Tax=Subsaxibacter sp. CAU 1640 TaxID=2933271 RepID=UPI00200635B4|nr:hypothetical protein [Subsaxibacter sp. CAU 1640]MCK7591104.1 hypothetical protein [Subsaxibacter sp. CAU 1640]